MDTRLPRPIRAVVWDFDGTLVDSPVAVRAATDAALVVRGFAATGSLDEVRAGMVWPTVPRMARHAGLGDADPRAAALAEDFYRHAAALFPTHARPFPGIAELMHRLALPQAVVTNNHGGMVRTTLAACGLARYVVTVLGDGDLPAPKPDPRGPWMAAAACGIAPTDCVYIGDSPIDRDTARAAGMLALGVAWGTTPRAQMTGFDALVDGVGELERLISPAA